MATVEERIIRFAKAVAGENVGIDISISAPVLDRNGAHQVALMACGILGDRFLLFPTATAVLVTDGRMSLRLTFGEAARP
jgi:hypothetical protein